MVSEPPIDGVQSSGRKVACYFSAGSYENWRPDAADFSRADLGSVLAGWDAEKWLDIRSAHVRRIMQKRPDLAKQKGATVSSRITWMVTRMLVEYFDFSVNEQCHEFNECSLLAPFINAGKPVLNAEYQEELIANTARRQALCDAAAREGFSTLILPVQLDDSFRYRCP